MSDLSPVPAPKEATSFANLLATFTGAAKKSNDIWDDSALLDDVTAISYEQALRSHRRIPAADLATAQSPVQEAPLSADAVALMPFADAGIKKRKSASITIRLTETEDAQLHERAAAAQLSVSAYLRSCIFEAESLRSQVKEALSQMKVAPESESHPSNEMPPKPAPNWRARLFPHWPRHRTSA
jgi:hypothetical protein